MTTRSYSPEFKIECTLLVLKHNYSIREACEATGVGLTAMRRWVKQLQAEQNGIPPHARQSINA